MEAEEVRDASRVLPLRIMWAVLFNGFTSFTMVLTFCFCVGYIEDALSIPLGQPYIQVMFQRHEFPCRGHNHGDLYHLTTLFGTIGVVATASRQMYTFARDRGLPFASFLNHTCIWRQIGKNLPFIIYQNGERSNQAGTFP